MAIFRVMVGKNISGEYDVFAHAENEQEAIDKFNKYIVLCPLPEKAKKELEAKSRTKAVEIEEGFDSDYPDKVIEEFRQLADHTDWIISNSIRMEEYPHAT